MGLYRGRKPALTADPARELPRRAQAFGISRETVYPYLRPAPALPRPSRRFLKGCQPLLRWTAASCAVGGCSPLIR